LALLAIPASLIYLTWVYLHLECQVAWLSTLFFGAEIAAFGIVTAFFVITWYPRFHHPEGVVDDGQRTVDIFITVCGEPFAMVANTVQAALAIDYSPKRVYLLDDKNNWKFQRLAAELGCEYLARPDHADAKAGNLNYGLAHSNGEIVVALDADQVPEPTFLRRTIGFFRLQDIGWVQTKQNYVVPEGDPFCNLDPAFYGVAQLSKDNDNAAFSCGSGVLYRRKALESINGFSTWNLVEDLHTSMRLHATGWRSVYYNHALTLGTAPADIWGVYRQRQQWATDSLRIFFWDNPFLKKGLTWRQRFHYAHIGFVYLFAAFVMPFFYLLPVYSLFTGGSVLTTSLMAYLLYRAPCYLLSTLAYQAAMAPHPFYRATNTWLSYFPCFIKATFIALAHPKNKPTYRVNKKTWDSTTPWNQLLGFVPQLAVIVLSLAAVVYGLYYASGPLQPRLVNCLWALWTVERLHWVCLLPWRSRRLAPAPAMAGLRLAKLPSAA
jgi:cellulose synthase (UDP-forming)